MRVFGDISGAVINLEAYFQLPDVNKSIFVAKKKSFDDMVSAFVEPLDDFVDMKSLFVYIWKNPCIASKNTYVCLIIYIFFKQLTRIITYYLRTQ